MSKLWVNYFENKTRSDVPKIPKPWPATFENKKKGVRPAESDAPAQNILIVRKLCWETNVFKRFSEFRKTPNSKNACPHRGPRKPKIGPQYLKNENPKRCLDKRKAYRFNILKCQKQCVNNSQIGTPSMSKLWVQYFKNQNEKRCPEHPKPLTDNLRKTKTGVWPATSDAPMQPPLVFAKSMIEEVMFPNGFRKLAKRQPQTTHARITVPKNQKPGSSISKTKTQNGASTNQKHTGPIFLKTQSGGSTFRKAGPRHVKTLGIILHKQNEKRCPGNPNTLADNRWEKTGPRPAEPDVTAQKPLVSEAHVRKTNVFKRHPEISKAQASNTSCPQRGPNKIKNMATASHKRKPKAVPRQIKNTQAQHS